MIEELSKFIDAQDERLKRYYQYADDEKRIFTRTIKLGEEFGELCNAILAANSIQRKEKLDNHDAENLSEEFADVLITTLLVAKSMKIDVEAALLKKIEKLIKRFEKK